MQFTQVEFLILFLIVLVLVWRTNSSRHRNVLLLAFSYYFYAYWDIRFCGLLLLSTLVDFFIAARIASCPAKSGKRWFLAVSILVNLGVLGFFKYFNFFVESAAAILHPLGLHPGSLEIILPVGISFYTFQTLSYTIDVYRGKIRPTGSILDFALYVAFFPQLVAGPIVRASELLPQLQQCPVWSRGRFYSGFSILMRGMLKKVLLADRMAEMADVVFAGPEHYSTVTIWLAVIAYSGQIYYDFSGYSDMAIGIAKMLGYRFPINFRHPYLSTSLSDFWRRWHITLSRWLRDYVYISLGGSRSGAYRTSINLLITMLLGGLWHGASWTFVIWGLLHGVALVLEHKLRRQDGTSIPTAVRSLLTLAVVVVGWVLFRSSTIGEAFTMYLRMLVPSDGIQWFPPLAILAMILMVCEHAAWQTRLRLKMRMPVDHWYSPVAITVMIWALILYSPQEFRPFVYFQF